MSKIKSIDSEPAEGHAQNERRQIFWASRPIAFDVFGKISTSKAQNVRLDGAVGAVSGHARRVAVRAWLAVLLEGLGEEAKSTHKISTKTSLFLPIFELGNALNIRLWLARRCDWLAVGAVELLVEIAFDAGKIEIGAFCGVFAAARLLDQRFFLKRGNFEFLKVKFQIPKIR